MKSISCHADFTKQSDAPIIKGKFGLYICTYVDLDRILRDIETARSLCAGALRYDPGWGFGNDDGLNSPREIDAPQVTIRDGEIHIYWDGMDRVANQIGKTNMESCIVHAYTPVDLQTPDAPLQEGNETLGMRSRWNTMPEDMAVWRKLNYQYAAHWAKQSGGVKRHEIWNEPDLQPVFFTGNKDEYNQLYALGAQAVKEANPQALVGGPSISSDAAWADAFLACVEMENLPMDFFSYHTYGDPDEMVEKMRTVLRKYPWTRNLEMLLTEYNAFVPATADFTTGGGIEHIACASKLLHAFNYFLHQPDVHCVYWAQLQDPEVFGKNVDRCGLLDLEGKPKPAFYAWQCFAKLPSQRLHLEISSDAIEGIAAADDAQAHILLWNQTNTPQPFALTLAGLAVKDYVVEITKLDETVGESMPQTWVQSAGAALPDVLSQYGVYHFVFHLKQKKKLTPLPACPIRVLRYVDTPGCSMYAEWSAEDACIHMGMGGSPTGAAWLGFMPVEQMPWKTIKLQHFPDESSATCVFVFDGTRTRVYGMGIEEIPQIPWGRQWGEMVKMPWAGEKIAIEEGNALLFYLQSTKAFDRLLWQLGEGV